MGQTVLITGTSSGIGKAAAKRFQREGWNVVATMRDPGKERELTALENVLVTRLDVTDVDSIRQAVTQATEHFGPIDVLVNNAGFGAFGILEASPVEAIKSQFDTNVFGVIETIKAVLPGMRARREGLILNVSSMGGKIAFPLGSLYHGTKFALEGLSEALSYELAAIGVTIKLIEPGGVKTEFGGHNFIFAKDDSMAEYRDIVAKVEKGFAAFWHVSEEVDGVADVIYTAATDGSRQLRYISGNDAQQILALRKSSDDETVLATFRKQFDL